MKVKQMVFLAAALLLVSLSGIAQEVGVNRGMLRFDSIAAYERYAENLNNRDVIRTVATGSDEVTTMQEAGRNPQREGEDLYPEFLLSILNSDNIVNISNFLIKIDLENDRALIVDQNVANSYSLLVNNEVNAEGVMVFSGEEENVIETLEMIEANIASSKNYMDWSSTSPQGRGCPGAARNKDNDRAYLWSTLSEKGYCNNSTAEYRMDNKVVYQKFFIYFSLQSKGKSMKGCTYSNWILVPSYTANLGLAGKVRYRKRCRNEIAESRIIPSYINSVISWRPYEASRSLSHYDFSVTFGSQHTWSSAPQVQSRVYRIVSGY